MRARRPRESAIQAAVLAHWRALGLPDTLVAAIPNAGAMGQPGLTKGLPDLLVMGGTVRIGFIELKAEHGREGVKQAAFRELCTVLGIPCVLARGRDEPIAVLGRWGVVRPQVATDVRRWPGRRVA